MESGCNYVKEPRNKEREEGKRKRKRKQDRKLQEREQKELERQQEERERERKKLEREELERQQDEREQEEREQEECEREECEREEREREGQEREEREREKRERQEQEREEREREEQEREEQEREQQEREQQEREQQEREEREREREEPERDESEREERERNPLAFKTLKRKIKALENNETFMYKKMSCMAKDLHEIKNVLKCENRSNAPFDEDSYFAILPKFPLKKIERVNAMEASVNESYEYKKRLLCKLCTIGGSNVKKNVINIFKRMFSPKLKTKFCWNGTVRGKVEFKNYEGILDVIRQAVRCTEAELENECKLRFNQAYKDYDREKQKNAERV